MIKKIVKEVRNRYRRFQLYNKYKEVLDNNKELKNTKEGGRCFIMGTGPSIKDQDLLKLRDEETFVVNYFWKHPEFKEIRPKYYVHMDPGLFYDTDGEPNYWTKEFIRSSKLLSSMPIKLFFNTKIMDVVESKNLFPSNEIYCLATDGFLKENLDFNTDISRVIPNTKNVIIACIIIAAYMGFEEIYLLGCEHDFLAYPNNYEWSPHFYKNEDFDMKNPDDVKKYNLSVTSYESVINHAGKLFKNYRLLKEKLAKEKLSVKIYNATPNSFLDVFPMIDFEDIKFDGFR